MTCFADVVNAPRLFDLNKAFFKYLSCKKSQTSLIKKIYISNKILESFDIRTCFFWESLPRLTWQLKRFLKTKQINVLKIRFRTLTYMRFLIHLTYHLARYHYTCSPNKTWYQHLILLKWLSSLNLPCREVFFSYLLWKLLYMCL